MIVQLTAVLELKLVQLAAEADRTPDQVAHDALDQYLSHVEALTAAAREGEESAEREGWLTTDEVFESLNNRLMKTA